MYRYVAIALNASTPEAIRTYRSIRNRILADAQWTASCDAPTHLVAATAMGPRGGRLLRLTPGCGAVVGNLFRRNTSTSFAPVMSDFSADESRSIADSGGRHLIEHYWGSYVAMVHDSAEQTHHVFRGPLGNLPCYHTSHVGIEVFFSHVDDCIRLLDLSPSVERRYLARWLTFCELSTRETGLENIEDLPGGERISFGRRTNRRLLIWNPVEIAQTPRFEDPTEAAEALRATVQAAVDAWAACYDRIVVRLSGGLDSSIVAGCLARAPTRPAVSYLNFAIDVAFVEDRPNLCANRPLSASDLAAMTGTGDERQFARLVAKKWATPLIERSRDLALDLKRLWQAPLKVAPAQYFTVMEVDDAEVELAQDAGVQAFFTGQAGDSVFQLTAQPLAAIDYACRHGVGHGLWHHAMASARLSRQSVWSVLAKSMKYGLLGARYATGTSAFLSEPTLLTHETRSELTEQDFANPWTQIASILPPGKQDHVTGLANSGYHNFIFRAGTCADYVDPLDSQPLWETMLQIPTYTILTGGVSRGLARMAFAELLPQEIRIRQAKGSGSSFYKTLVQSNRKFIREVLGEGCLARSGYLDRDKLDQCFAMSDSPQVACPTHILTCVAAEVWLQQCSQTANSTHSSALAVSR